MIKKRFADVLLWSIIYYFDSSLIVSLTSDSLVLFTVGISACFVSSAFFPQQSFFDPKSLENHLEQQHLHIIFVELVYQL